MTKTALVTGVTGQDGAYLAELLLGKGYSVHGIIRRSSSFNTARIEHLYSDPHSPTTNLHLHYGDLADGGSLQRILREVRPDEVYNLGAQSHVRVSFDHAEYTADVDGLGILRLLEAIRDLENRPRFYQASSSEMFGSAPPPQNEQTPFHPRSPYACAKAFGYHLAVNYREAYGIFACNGILFNHESPLRGETFASRKVTRAATRIKLGLQSKLFMGNLDAQRDWGFAGDYVEAMWLILQQEKPDDYVIATGEIHTVRDLVAEAFGCLDLNWKDYVEIDPRYYRPSEVDALQGDAAKAKRVLGWEPRIRFRDLIRMMIDADMLLAEKEAFLRKHGKN